jgi:tRNA threonylcarbamoyladenosine biosynthesis protein TsaB
MKLLALDTATEQCSAALWLDGPAGMREAQRERGHGELILPMIDGLLKQAAIGLRQLDAVAFGRGPGAFTGVRMAVSLAQGLGWSSGLPLIPVSNLRAVAARMLGSPGGPTRAIVCMDARMQEVYWGCFERRGDTICAVGRERVGPAASVVLPADWSAGEVCGAGSGWSAYRSELSISLPALQAMDDITLPHAREIAWLAACDGLELAVRAEDAQPVYLRDDVAKIPGADAASAPSSN